VGEYSFVRVTVTVWCGCPNNVRPRWSAGPSGRRSLAYNIRCHRGKGEPA